MGSFIEFILTCCAYLGFFAFLSFAVINDIKARIIPNWVVFGTLSIWLVWQVLSLFVADRAAILIGAFSDLIGALTVFAILLVFTVLAEKVSRRYLFGGGDIKLVSASALFLGVEGVAVALFFACGISLIYAVAKLPKGIPFAPCMLCGSLMAILI